VECIGCITYIDHAESM